MRHPERSPHAARRSLRRLACRAGLAALLSAGALAPWTLAWGTPEAAPSARAGASAPGSVTDALPCTQWRTSTQRDGSRWQRCTLAAPLQIAGVRWRDTVFIDPQGFLWRTADPFLFCVHHDDAYPRATSVWGRRRRWRGATWAGLRGPRRLAHVPRRRGARLPATPAPRLRDGDDRARGLIDHSDSLGATARFGGGDVQWLTAGRASCTRRCSRWSSATREPARAVPDLAEPAAADKMVAPHFSMLWRERSRGHVEDAAGRARPARWHVIAGQLGRHGRRRRRPTRGRRAPTATWRSGRSR
jgi:hypothetical protein